MDQVAIMLKSGKKKTFTSHFVFEAEMLRHRAKTVRFTPGGGGGGGTPFEGLHGDVRPARVCFSRFLS